MFHSDFNSGRDFRSSIKFSVTVLYYKNKFTKIVESQFYIDIVYADCRFIDMLFLKVKVIMPDHNCI